MPQLSTARVRRAAAFAVAAAVVGVSLTACSSGSGSGGKEPQTFTFAFSESNASDTSAVQVAQAFEKLHKGVKITLQKLPAESYAQAIATRIQGGNAPDAFEAESGSRPDRLDPALRQGGPAARADRPRDQDGR